MTTANQIGNPLAAFKSVTIFNLDISYTPGFKKLPKAELQRLYGSVPPEKYITSGQARLYPRSEVQIFDTFRVGARALCRQAGISFMGGFAVPVHRVPNLVKSLDELRNKFIVAKAGFIANAAAKSQVWIESAPDEYKSILRSCTYSSDELDRKIGFEYSYFQISTGDSDSDDGEVVSVSDGLVRQASSMSDKLLEEIQKDALDAWTQTISKKDQCTQSTVNRVKKLLGKLEDLSWLSPKTTAISRQANAIVEALPDKGPITGKDFYSFRYLVLLLSDKDKIHTLADQSWQQTGDEDDISVFSEPNNTRSKEELEIGNAAISAVKSIFDSGDDQGVIDEETDELDFMSFSTPHPVSNTSLSDQPESVDDPATNEGHDNPTGTDVVDIEDEEQLDIFGGISPTNQTLAVDDALSLQGGADFPVTKGF